MGDLPAAGRRCSMISSARKLPALHISIRVPWHDSGWVGAVYDRLDLNTSCRALSWIANTSCRALSWIAEARGVTNKKTGSPSPEIPFDVVELGGLEPPTSRVRF